MGYKILGDDSKLKIFSKKINNIVIGIGQIRNFNQRIEIFKICKRLGYKFPVIKSKNSYVSKNVSIGEEQ